MRRSSFRLAICLATIVVFINSSVISRSLAEDKNFHRIKPYNKNPHYWQYKDKPVLLLGGSKDDSLFQIPNLKEHLDELHAVGGNYIRNTMSDRPDHDFEVYAFRKLSSGKYDLDQWSDEYWQRFENLLKWTEERDIIVQIEVWDRFDYSRKNWQTSPWNPLNNVNYSRAQTGFDATYPRHPGMGKQPFFHTVPGLSQHDIKLSLVRAYQEAFVAKMLSYSLGYGNVLYCMDNETSTPAQWGKYWIKFIKAKATEKNVTVCTTDMFDDGWDPENSKQTPIIFQDADNYMFADISQLNSRNYDQTHWDRLQWVLEKVNTHPRPSNHTKIYGSGFKSFGTGAPEDGIERFWRNIIGGSASSRFHRPDSGNGLNDLAKASIKAARILEDRIKLWDVTPHMELLSGRESNEAYLAAKPGKSYALYFTNGGSVQLDLSDTEGPFNVTWISVSMGITTRTSAAGRYHPMENTVQGGQVITIAAPYKGGWVAAIVKK